MSRFWLNKGYDAKMTVSGSTVAQQESVVLAETFERHWDQLKGITNNNTVPSPDDVVAVINLLNQMTALLALELAALSDESDLPSLGSSNQYDSLLGSEPSSLGINPCLDILLTENILSHVLAASRMPISQDQQDQLRLEQLKMYEVLLDQTSARARSLLGHQPFLKPLLEVLNELSQSEKLCNESQDHLVMLLNQLCSRLRDSMEMIEVFFNVKEDKFVIFSILMRFLHSDGHVGSQARDALLLCISLSKTHEGIGRFIATGTDFCQHLAYGLSGMYSSLPRKLEGPNFTDSSWYRLSNMDLSHLPDVVKFLATLEFCDAVIQAAHSSVQDELLGLIYMGFLDSVVKPALTQEHQIMLHKDEPTNRRLFSCPWKMRNSLESELVCSTAYLELFIRRITEPKFLAVFLRFLFTDSHEDKPIIDIMVSRLALQSQLSAVSLSFFETLIGLNCEDVMLWLIFKHLIPQTAFLPSQRPTIRHPDIHGRAAEKLLRLTPICCLEARNANVLGNLNSSSNSGTNGGTSSLPTFLVGFGRPAAEEGIAVDTASEAVASVPDSLDYQSYLMDARKAVRNRFEATRCWQYDYDGLHPPSDASSENKTTTSNYDLNCDITSNCSTPYGSAPVSLTEEEDKEFWSLMRSAPSDIPSLKSIKKRLGDSSSNLSSGGYSSSHDELFSSPREEETVVGMAQRLQHRSQRAKVKPEDIDNSICSLGLFLDLLFEHVELMPTNSLSTNMLVTSILSQLASYPQPLLRAVLVHPDICLQPSVRGLFTAVASLRQKLDNIMPTFPGSDEAILASRKHLQERLNVHPKRRDSNVSVISAITHIGNEASRATKNSITSAFSSIFRSKKSNSSSSSNPHSPINNSSTLSMSSNRSSISNSNSKSNLSELSNKDPLSRFGAEVRGYAMAAVILEEWLQELAAIAQEQSVLMKEIAFHVGMALDSQDNSTMPAKKNSAIITDHPAVVNRANNLETSMS